MRRILYTFLAFALLALGVGLHACADFRPTWIADISDIPVTDHVAVIGRRVVFSAGRGVAGDLQREGHPDDRPPDEILLDGPVAVFDLADGSRRRTGWDGLEFGRMVIDRARGRLYAVGTDDAAPLRRLDVESGEAKSFALPAGRVDRLYVAPDGSRVAAVVLPRPGKPVLVALDAETGVSRSVELAGMPDDPPGWPFVSFVSPRFMLVQDRAAGLRPLDALSLAYLPPVAPADAGVSVDAGFVHVGRHEGPSSLWSLAGDVPEKLHDIPRGGVLGSPDGDSVGWIAPGPTLCVRGRGAKSATITGLPPGEHRLHCLSKRGEFAMVEQTGPGGVSARLLHVESGRTVWRDDTKAPHVSDDARLLLRRYEKLNTLIDARTGAELLRVVESLGCPPSRYLLLCGSHVATGELRTSLRGLPFSFVPPRIDGVGYVPTWRYETIASATGRVRLRLCRDHCFPITDPSPEGYVLARTETALLRYDLDGGKPWTLIVGVPLLLGGLAAGTDRLRRRPKKGHGG